MYEYKVKRVVKVVDGDTVDLELDLGFHCSITERFRLKDIDAPEHGQEGYYKSKLALVDLLSATDNPRRVLFVRINKRGSFK
jgi:endonuclease YncB( thermonuclease family)